MQPQGPASTTGKGLNVKIASITLPPDVKGEIKGELVICLQSLSWRYRKPPQQVQVRFRWGSTADTVVPFHSTRGAGAAFPVTCGPRYLSRYLKDMGSLTVHLEECPSGRSVGTMSIAVSQLDIGRPLEASVPCHGAHQQHLATADFSMRVGFTNIITSFEMNEHLASTDKQLPLYPVPGLEGARNRQQQNISVQANAAGLPSAVSGKENMPTNLDSRQGPRTQKLSEKLVSQAPIPSTAKLHQPVQHGHDVADVLICTEQPQQQMPGQAIVQHAVESIPPASDAPADPMLEVIQKAEQLKQAMEQAASRGISVALPSAGLASTNPQFQQQEPYYNIPLLQQQQVYGVQWPQGSPLPGLTAVAASQQPSAIAVEAIKSCLYGGAAVYPGTTHNLQLITAASTAAGSAGVEPVSAAAAAVGERSDSAEVRQQLSPLVAALLQSSAALGVEDDTDASEVDEVTSGATDDSGDITELEDLEELEDLLLQELLSVRCTQRSSPSKKQQQSVLKQQQQQAQQHGHLHTVLSETHTTTEAAANSVSSAAVDEEPGVKSAADDKHNSTTYKEATPAATPAAVADDTATQHEVSGRLLLITVSAVELSQAQDTAVLTAVVKSAGRSQQLDVTPLLQQCAGSAPAISTLVQGPVSLSSFSLLADKPYLAVELWKGAPTATAANRTTRELLGIARVLLRCGTFIPAASTLQAWQQAECLASGTYPLYDVLRGQYTGSIQLTVTLAAEAESDAMDDVSEVSTASADETRTVLALQHVIDVTLQSINALPSDLELQEGGHLVPESRFLQYSFPGEEPLFTQEVDCISAPTFSAHAQHTVLLPPDQSLVDCFNSGEGHQDESLEFLVYNKWQDDTDSVVAFGSLSLQQVLELSQVDHPATSEGSKSTKSFFVPLQLAAGSGEAAIQPPQRAALLQITISHTASNCYELLDNHAERSKEQAQQATAVRAEREVVEDAITVAGEEEKQPQPPPAVVCTEAADFVDDEGNGHDAQQDHIPVSPTAQLSTTAPAAAASSPKHSEELDGHGSAPPHRMQLEDNLLPLQHHKTQLEDNLLPLQHQEMQLDDEPAINQGIRQHCMEAAGDQQHAEPQHTQALDCPTVPNKLYVPAQLQQDQTDLQQCNQPLTAEICVEVIRACGLQAAVFEAEKCLGGHSSLLGSARRLGPHPYVTINLLQHTNSIATASSKSMAAIKTPFQAQTFCPQFHYKQLVPLVLDISTVRALASQASLVELWHHCPRSQAVAAALSRGHSSSFVMSRQQQVLLGAAVLSIHELLIKPQGIRTWLVLKSTYGQAVGAVQVAVYFSHIAGQTLNSCPTADAPLSRYPQLLQLLPPSSTPLLTPFLSCPPEGLQGQLAAVSVHIQELILPGGEQLMMERPRIANYVAAYRLPGREREEHTQAKANSSQRSSTSSTLLSQSWHVDWQYCGRHWVAADWRLGKALLAYPMLITIHKQEVTRNSSIGSHPQHMMVPVGSVEVDLSSLLHIRAGAQRPSCRWLSGEYTVIHPMAKNLGNVRLKVKVLLELQPAEALAFDAVKQTSAYWQISGPLAAAAAPDGVQTAEHTASAPAVGTGKVAEDAELDLLTSTLDKQADSSSHIAAVTAAACAPADADDDDAIGLQDGQEPQRASAAHSTDNVAAAVDVPLDVQHGNKSQGQVATVNTADNGVAVGLAAQPQSTATNTPVMPLTSSLPSSFVAATFEPSAAGGRVRAEMTHSSAPVSAVISRSTSPSPDLQHQQQHPGASDTFQHQQLKQQHLSDIRVCIESALNLDLPLLPEGQVACLYVQYVWRESGSSITTPLVMADCGPLGQTASAKWFHSMHLPMAPQQRTSAEVRCKGDETLVLQVLLRALPYPEAHALPPLYAGVAADPLPTDVFLGHAVLDLAALQMLGSIEGWYSLCDNYQLLKGQVKVSLTPLRQPHDSRRVSEPGTGEQQSWLEESAITAAASSLSSRLDGLGSPSASAADVLMLECVDSGIDIPLQLGNNLQSAVTAAAESPRDYLTSSVQLLQPARDSAALADVHADEFQWGLDADLRATVQHLQVLRQSADTHEYTGKVASTSEEGVIETDDLLQSLRANLQELDQISAALKQRARSSFSADRCPDDESALSLRDSVQQQDQQQAEPHKHQPPIPSHTSQQPALTAQQQSTPTPDLEHRSSGSCGNDQQPGVIPVLMSETAQAAAAAARAHAFRHVQTLSDDEEYLVMGAAVTDSDTDTEELMGRVDWSMAQCSDDYDAPAGPPSHNCTSVQMAAAAAAPAQAPAAASFAAAAAAVCSAPLNNEDWMFDIGRPATGGGAAPFTVGRLDTTSDLVNPAQLSQPQAAAQQAAAAQRLAQLRAASAAAAAARAAAVERAAAAEASRHDPVQASRSVGNDPSQSATAAAGGAAVNHDVWDELAAVEEQEEQQQQHQQQQQHVHDNRELPEDLNVRLDMLLASFQAAVNPGPASRAATAAVTSTPDVDSLSDDDFLPADRTVHHPADGDSMSAGVGFANCLPPIQDDFVLEYSDGPQRRTAAVQHTAAATAAATAAKAIPGRCLAANAIDSGTSSSSPTQCSDSVRYREPEAPKPSASRSERSKEQGVSQPQQQQQLTAARSSHPAMHPAGAAAAAAAVQAAAATQQLSASVAMTGAGSSGDAGVMLPVVGCWSSAAMDDMFSISKRSTSVSGGPVAHPGFVATASTAAGRQQASNSQVAQHRRQQQQQVQEPVETAADQVSGSGRSSVPPVAASTASPQAASVASTSGGGNGVDNRGGNTTASAVVPVLGRHSAAALDDMFSFRKSGSSSSSGQKISSGIKHPYM